MTEESISSCTISITSQESTVTLGQPIHFSATASCPSGTPEIQWYQRINNVWQVVAAYNTSTTLTFDTSSSAVMVNNFYAAVRQQGTTTPVTNSNTVSVTINDNVPPCTKVVLTAPANNSTGVAGTPINLAATATCPGPSECQFWYKLSTSGTWTVMPGYSSSCTGVFTPPTQGTWNLQAVARVQGAHVQYSARSASIGVVISPAPINHPPVAVDDTATTNQHTAATISVIANDTDQDGDPLTVTAVTTPNNGTATFSGGNVTYTPTGHFVGQDSFQYTISDGKGGSASATVTVTVVDQNPVAVNDSVSTTVHAAVTFDPTVNDTDADGDSLTVTAVGAATNGTVSQSGNNLTYTPNTSWGGGTDSFTYTISDGVGGTASATVTVTVTNRTPVAGDDSLSTPANSAAQVDVGTNDSDPDGDALTWAVGTAPAHGGVTFSGSVATYTPATNFVGTDSFTYTATDVYGASATATVSVTVTDIAPIANNDTATTPANQAVQINVLANDVDPDGDALSVTSVGTASNGGASIGAGGVITYTPNANFVGSDSFAYTVTDTHGSTGTATVTVTVTNLPPVANNDSLTTNMNVQGSVNVLANDSDPDNDGLTVTAVGAAAHGLTSIGSGGAVNYQPNNNYVGSDSFSYTITDGHGATASATVNVTVSSVTVGCTISLATTTPSVVWGNNIHLDATASCNTGPAQVQFYRRDNSNWTIIQQYSSTTSIDTPAMQAVGTVQYYAAVRTQGTMTPVTSSNTVSITVADNVPSCTSVKMTQPVNAFTGTVGTPLTLAASANCGAGTPEYQFYVKLSSSNVWTALPGYTQTTSSWTPPSAGTWNIKAAARSVGAHTSYSGMSSAITGTIN